MSGPRDIRPAPPLPPGRRLALVVATSRYADPALSQLRAPVHDAFELAAILRDPHIGGFGVTSVIDQPAQQIRIAMEDFLSDRRTDDLLVIYLSCHGLMDARRRLYFAASDTVKNRLAATGVESQWLLEQMDDCRARRQVVILDCCFSGAFAHGAKGDTDLGLRERFAAHGRGRVVLTASRNTEYSFEGQPVGGSPTTKGSVFTAALIDGLRTGLADSDNDGYISVDEAYAYAYARVMAVEAGQTPQRWLYGAEGTIVLVRSPAGISVAATPLADAIRAGLDSPYPTIRLGAVTTLGEWLSDEDAGKNVTARAVLEQVASADIPHIAAAARGLLQAGRYRDASQPSPTAASVAWSAHLPRTEAKNNSPVTRQYQPTGSSFRTHYLHALRITWRVVLCIVLMFLGIFVSFGSTAAVEDALGRSQTDGPAWAGFIAMPLLYLIFYAVMWLLTRDLWANLLVLVAVVAFGLAIHGIVLTATGIPALGMVSFLVWFSMLVGCILLLVRDSRPSWSTVKRKLFIKLSRQQRG
jgi:Caspase domain